eukprot:GGOE01021985.1.p1 GENE.GGOE01021985.1~~GGOE01021985.1.p1  ORF type:complete len:665 (-),score=261.02 GGOE01021985.1:74-2068(-)
MVQPEPQRPPPGRSGPSLPSKRPRISSDDYEEPPDAPNDPRNKAEMDQFLKEKRKDIDTRAGGVYIPPFRLRSLQTEVLTKDPASAEAQRLLWDALKKSINGLINKVNVVNIKNIVPEVFSENILRGKGLLCRALMKAQAASPAFTPVFAAMAAVVNTKIPEIGELLVTRIIISWRRAFRRNDKLLCVTLAKFLAHLTNQKVVDENLALEMLTLLLDKPTDDSVEVAVGLVKDVGAALHEISAMGLHAIFERFRAILNEGDLDKRTQYMIEGLFLVRKSKFAGFPPFPEDLDLIEEDNLWPSGAPVPTDFQKNEALFTQIRKEILGDDSDVEAGDAEDEGDDEEADEEAAKLQEINDQSEQTKTQLRRTLYLTIMSSLDFEECAHKVLKSPISLDGKEDEVCNMLIECCAQSRTYLRFFGLLGQRFCMLKRVYQDRFEDCFKTQYSMIHRLETNKLRNVAKFFAHLLHSDALPWTVLQYIHLNEGETTSSSRIFIKILFQELAEHMGLVKLNERLHDKSLEESFDGLFPKDNPKNTRFAINFFVSIGLGGLTEELQTWLKNKPKEIMMQQRLAQQMLLQAEACSSSSSSSSSDSDSSGSSSGSIDSSSASSSSSSSSSDESRRKKRKKAASKKAASKAKKEKVKGEKEVKEEPEDRKRRKKERK